MSSLNQYTVNIVNADELYVQGKKIQNLDIGTLTTYNETYGVGIRTDNPRLTLDINGTDAMRIPIGTTAQRPLIANSDRFAGTTLSNSAKKRLEGCIRYNSSLALFEGWSTGNGQWENLANSSTLKIIPSNGYVGILTSGDPTEALEVNGNLRLNGDLMMTGNKKLHIGRYNNNEPNMSDSACVYIGGQHNVTNTLLKIADYDNDYTTSSNKVVHFYSENSQTDYYFQAATNGGYHYYRGYLGIGVPPSSSYRVYANGNAYITGNLGLGGYSSSYKLYVVGNSYLTGNLGVGGYSSSYKLYVNGKTLFNNGVTIQGNSSSTYGLSVSSGIYYNSSSNYYSITGSIGSGYIQWHSYYYWSSYYRTYQVFFNAVYTTAGKISIRASNAVFASKFIVSSDERIKENIELVPDDLSLTIIRKLEPKYYTYKDKLDKGDKNQIGFMAQDVYKYIPDAVRFTTKVIPNEMRSVSSPIWTTFHDLSGNLKYKLTISDLKDPSGNTVYRFFVSDNKDGDDEEEKEVSSLQNEPNSFVFDKEWNNIYLYGKLVDDFHVLDKAKIWAVAYSALQEVDKIQQNEQTKLKEAESKIKNLENQLASVLSRLSNLEKN
jgi:hypothetical protein